MKVMESGVIKEGVMMLGVMKKGVIKGGVIDGVRGKRTMGTPWKSFAGGHQGATAEGNL